MGENLKVRIATELDLESVLSIEQEAYGTDAYSYLVLREMFDVAGKYFLVAESGEIVGFVHGGLNAHTNVGWLTNLVVLESSHRTGVGSHLTKCLVETLIQDGALSVCLAVNPKNTAAIAMYEHCGFTQNVLKDNYYGPGEDRLMMRYSQES